MSSVREWWSRRDGNGDRRGDKVVDALAMWGLAVLLLAGFLAMCWLIAAAKRGHW
jgi:hypothetical protein